MATPGPVVAAVADAAVHSSADPALRPLGPGARLVLAGLRHLTERHAEPRRSPEAGVVSLARY